MEIDYQTREQLASLASNYYNRYWMKNYIFGCLIIENAAQNLQLGIIGGRGVTTILEYNIELSRHIDGLTKILLHTNDMTSEMAPWINSILGHMVFLRNTIHGVDINDLIGLLRPLQLIKLGVTESRLGMEEAITRVDKKIFDDGKWENQMRLPH